MKTAKKELLPWQKEAQQRQRWINALAKRLTFKPFKYEEDTECGFLYRTEATAAQVRPGAVLKLRPAENRSKYVLVGDVNRLLGVCDDCTDFDLKDIVSIAYIYQLWEDA